MAGANRSTCIGLVFVGGDQEPDVAVRKDGTTFLVTQRIKGMREIVADCATQEIADAVAKHLRGDHGP